MSACEVTFLAIAIIALFILRICYVLIKIYTTECNLRSHKGGLKTILCIGSGGHTTELLRMAKNLNYEKFHPRLYVVADNDTNSEVKITVNEVDKNDFTISKIPRSRNVKQCYTSSVFSTMYAFTCLLPIVYKFKPDIIFCNGPGTCVPLCVVAFVFRCLFILDCRIVFIESICRVRTLSLTGKILQFFVDIFVVQWPQLRNVCFRAKYFGRLT